MKRKEKGVLKVQFKKDRDILLEESPTASSPTTIQAKTGKKRSYTIMIITDPSKNPTLTQLWDQNTTKGSQLDLNTAEEIVLRHSQMTPLGQRLSKWATAFEKKFGSNDCFKPIVFWELRSRKYYEENESLR